MRTEAGRASERKRGWRPTWKSSHTAIRHSSFGPGQEPPFERFTIAGTPEEVAARVEELWAAGADRVELGTPQGRTTEAGVELICNRVVPLFSR